MMLSSQEEQAERRSVFAQDQSVPNPATTMHAFALADAQTPRGRFSAIDASYVIGSKPDVAGAYPAASAAHQTELPPENPTGYCVDAMEPLEPSSSADAQGNSGDPTGDAPASTTPLVETVERVGSPPLSSRTYRRA